jgi:hypothetical protein
LTKIKKWKDTISRDYKWKTNIIIKTNLVKQNYSCLPIILVVFRFVWVVNKIVESVALGVDV